MFALGFRMGKKALEELDRGRENGVKLVAVVEFRNCLADGIQQVCGTTYGKNNLHYNDTGKFAASFYDLVSGKSIRIRIKNRVLEDTLDFGIAGQNVKKLPPESRGEKARGHFKKGKEIVEKFREMSDDDLFTITAAEPFNADSESSLDFMICDDCGELVLSYAVKENGEKKLCKTCFKRAK